MANLRNCWQEEIFNNGEYLKYDIEFIRQLVFDLTGDEETADMHAMEILAERQMRSALNRD